MTPKKNASSESTGPLTPETASIAFAEAKVLAKPEPDPIVGSVAVPQPIVHGPPCALEDAPVGAKCVVSRTDEGKKVRLLSPEGVVDVPEEDIFYTLPPGAKVRKVSATRYEAFQLGQSDRPLFAVPTAREAVSRYLKTVQ